MYFDGTMRLLIKQQNFFKEIKLETWWAQTDSPKTTVVKPRAVAYYRHSAQDRQENSVAIQQEQVREWAKQNGVDIIEEFSDRGKSGLTAEGRPGFTEMMENWVKKSADFDYILCLDVSRWGRFQDIDKSATYSAECRHHGKEVIYTTIGKPKEDDPLYPVYVQFERFRAAQYSRELSGKVFRGCAKIAEQGYWAGGFPPYGFKRLLLNEAREPVQTLKPGERKSIQNQRVKLTPGRNEDIQTIRRIFDEFVNSQYMESQIASGLNRDGIPSPGNQHWDVSKIRHILACELYIGTMVYNKTSQKLKTPTKQNPREKWVRSPGAFEPLISIELYSQAQQLFQERIRRFTPEVMLQRLSEHIENMKILRPSLLRADKTLVSPMAYAKHFGSLDAAYQKCYAGSLAQIQSQVYEEISQITSQVDLYNDFLVIDKRFTIMIQPSVPVEYGYSQYWYFRPDMRHVIDITLGVPVSKTPPYEIQGYMIFPRLFFGKRGIRLFGSSEFYLAMHGHRDLTFIKQLMR